MFLQDIRDWRVEQSRHDTLVVVDLHGVRVAIITPVAPTAIYPRNDALKIVIDGFDHPVWLKERITIDDLAKASGLRCYDCALPWGWANAEFLQKGLPFPRGVWSYDRSRIFGDFVSLAELIAMVGAGLQEVLGWDNLRLLSHDPAFSPVDQLPLRYNPDDSVHRVRQDNWN